MKFIILLCLIVPFGVGAQEGKLTKDTIFSFKGVSLGVTVEEFKKNKPITSESTSKFKTPEAICLTDKEKIKQGFSSLLELDTTTKILSVGGNACVYNDSVHFFKMLSTYYGFYFIGLNKEEEPKLFDMWFFIHNRDYTELLYELTKKYGPPKKRTEMLKNAFNSKFINEISVWENKLNKIELKKYSSDLETASLYFTLKLYEDFYYKKIKEEKDKSPSKI